MYLHDHLNKIVKDMMNLLVKCREACIVFLQCCRKPKLVFKILFATVRMVLSVILAPLHASNVVLNLLTFVT